MLDKQYSRVIRWIRRAQSMSADGNFSDAILDVECARAELDDARQELLLCHQGGNARRCVRTSVMILPAALAAVLFLASPLRVSESETPIVLSQMQRAEASGRRGDFSAPQLMRTETDRYNEWPTSEGKRTAEPMRSSAPPAQTGNSLQAAGNRSLTDTGMSGAEARTAARPRPAASKLSDADMYRLVEVGRKALYKSNNSVVLEFH
ncbi:hypothetical protein [Pyramidobacter piscolens]